MEVDRGKILAIDDNKEILLSLRVALAKHFDEVKTHTFPDNEAEKLISSGAYSVLLLDMNFTPGVTSGKQGLNFLEKALSIDPSLVVIMITAYGDIDLAVQAMKLVAADFVVKPWENKKLIATVSAAMTLAKSRRELAITKHQNKALSKDFDSPFTSIIGCSSAMQQVYTAIEKVAKTDANVLVLGENGTGKELVARAIHRMSHRKDEIFMSVDMGSIPETLFENELFGHMKGAFTDAHETRPGRFEMASGGTLFLDEIGNIPLTLQAKLLGVLQTRKVNRVGANTTRDVDIRLITATNADLCTEIANGNFRQDLYYRINTVEITLPPLRERGDDLLLLTQHFLTLHGNKYGKTGLALTKGAQRLLYAYHWPGNVRELSHTIERAVIMTDKKIIDSDSLHLTTPDYNPSRKSIQSSLRIDDIEREAIMAALKNNRGNITNAAKDLGMGRTTLYRKMIKYGL